ncbi:hypothetical protein TrLO_g14807 [Triparma laevis f. longispina]|uniref:Uncharacterized protein n=1 Tax=Triparma laevis f. longispina TaxID=1714387 RepID=A0A9W7FSI6_9STRA|nr:hypothetical protein TrLO_g14807 [Triparma laevis f. longispina]
MSSRSHSSSSRRSSLSRKSKRSESVSTGIFASLRSLVTGQDEGGEKKRRKKKRIYYAPPSQWKIQDFWPEGEWHNEQGMPVATVDGIGGRGRIDSTSSHGSLGQSVVDQMSTFQNLEQSMQTVINEIGLHSDSVTGDRSRVLGKYSRRDRTAANLLTAGIKARVIGEIRREALERILTEERESPLEGLEGKMAEAAFRAIYKDMTGGKGAGIKVLKHPRSSKPPRKIRLKFKKMEGSQLWLGDALDEEDDSSDDDSDENPRSRPGSPQETGRDEFGEESGWDHKELKYKVVNKKGEKGKKEEIGGGKEKNGREGPFLHYRGGFMNQTKRRMNLNTLVDVKKGIQTDILKREGGNQYKKHAFLSLFFEGEGERSLDLEVADGDVQVRDKLLHGFKFIVLKNQEYKKAMRAHSWDLDEAATNKKMREAWGGKSAAGENSDGVKVEIGPWLKQREMQRERERAGSISTETIPDEKKIEENFNVIKDGGEMMDMGNLPQDVGLGLSRNSSSTSELSFATATGNDEGFNDDISMGMGGYGIPRQKATVGGFLGDGGGGGKEKDPRIGLSLEMAS